MPRFPAFPAATVLGIAAIAMATPGSAAEAVPLRIGGHAHGAENVRALADLGIGNFVWIPALGYTMGNTPWDEEHDILADVDACVDRGMSFMVTERRGLGTIERGGGFPRGGHCSWDYHDEATVGEITRRGGDLFVGLHAEELDADLVQQTIRPIFTARTPEGWDYRDRAGGRRSFESELARQRDLYRGFGAPYLPNVCVTHHLSAFRVLAADPSPTGVAADLPIAELFEHLPTTELQLAMMRGGACQFDLDWGVWVSPWFWGQVPCEDKELWPAQPAQPGGGHDATELRRALWTSWVSGARLITVQETEPLFSRDPDGDGYQPAAWGRELRALWDVARAADAPMEPVVPLAVLVDEDHGWEPAHLWQNWNVRESVWGRLPIEPRADGMFRRYIDRLLPGFARTAESVAARADRYPGCFAATPHGPFDVVAADIDARRLAAYPAVVVLGRVEMDESLRATLRAYVEDGGVLLINVYQLLAGASFVEDELFFGAQLSEYPEWRYGEVIQPSARIELVDEVEGLAPGVRDEPYYAACRVIPTDPAEVVAHDGAGHPVLIRHRFGAGTVYLATPEYMMEGWGEQTATLGFFADLIGALARHRGPVTVEPVADISWIASRQNDGVVAAFANHGDESRETRLRWSEPAGQAEILFGESEVRTRRKGSTTRFAVTVPPRDVIVLRFHLGETMGAFMLDGVLDRD